MMAQSALNAGCSWIIPTCRMERLFADIADGEFLDSSGPAVSELTTVRSARFSNSINTKDSGLSPGRWGIG